jgi:hypothetical protein
MTGTHALLKEPLVFLTAVHAYLLNLIRLVCYLIYILILRIVGKTFLGLVVRVSG